MYIPKFSNNLSKEGLIRDKCIEKSKGAYLLGKRLY